jgi:ATP-dependent DNA helicase RecQ
VGVVKSAQKRVQAESTYEVTKELLLEGRSITDIADTREVTETTIWTHIEKLAQDGQLTADDVVVLEPKDIDWGKARDIFDAAIVKYGAEKLKPLYEAADEEYDYTLVRLARIQYQLEEKAATPAPF